MQDSAGQVRALADRVAVLDTVFAYAHALDTKDWAALPALFTDDAQVDFGGRAGTARGPEEIAEALRRPLRELDGSLHMVTNSVVRVSGDTTTHRACVFARHLRRGTPGGDLYVIVGRYDDRLRRTADGWRFSHRTLTRTWSDGNPAVLVG